MPIYKPSKFYFSDINDLVETLVKGGEGSGVKGHKTETAHRHVIMGGDIAQLKGLEAKYNQQIDLAIKRGDKRLEESLLRLRQEIRTRLPKAA